MAESLLQVGQVAALAGVSVDTVRYYERKRLLNRAPRSSGGFRLFTPEAIERIRFIKRAQDIGLSLDEIKELLVSTGGAAQCQCVRDLLREKLYELDERMRAMREFRRTLTRHLAACETELKEHGAAASCPVISKIAGSKRKAKK
jgi:DNA-binding transcriptional MerR regulator